MKRSKVSASVDYGKGGRQVGYLSAPHSRNESGWGAARFPIAVFKNGAGPTVLLTGGNHGDEYEGPIALVKLVQALDAAAIQGRVIVMPFLNAPAVLAGTRLSPIDGVNMNRAFPGDRDGTVTRMIAHYVHDEILPLADAVLDIHSGGKTMFFSPFGAIHELDDRGLMDRARRALLAFEPPIALVLRELDAEGMLDTAVETLGRVFVTTELGGGGTASTATIALAERGVRNLLKHFGILEGAPETRAALGLKPTRIMTMPADAYVAADEAGLLEMLVDLDDPVAAGQAIARVYRLDRPDLPPAVHRAGADGVLIGRCHGALVAPGDFLAMIARDA
jgi:N-alpha-acetyl-L-2,4-diaminobutyrate deacetylase